MIQILSILADKSAQDGFRCEIHENSRGDWRMHGFDGYRIRKDMIVVCIGVEILKVKVIHATNQKDKLELYTDIDGRRL